MVCGWTVVTYGFSQKKSEIYFFPSPTSYIITPDPSPHLISSQLLCPPFQLILHTINQMSLRRPPTRLQLKPEDVEEYEQVS